MRDAAGLYAGPIIDPHHHLFDRSLDKHPWLRGQTGVLGQSCLPADYLRDTAGYNVVGTVHVEAGWEPSEPFAELAWLDALEKPLWIARRYVGNAVLDAPEMPAILNRYAAHGKVVGVRDILSWHPDPSRSFSKDRHRMSSPAWRAGLKHLDSLGLSFDLMISPWQAAEALELARAFPSLLFIVNHCGSPFDRTEEGMAHWRAGISALASAPNVTIKVSDLPAYDPRWTIDSLRPVVLDCLEAFGTDRTMLASDHPVLGLSSTFDQAYQAFRVILKGLSDDEAGAVFWGNANRLYRIGM